MKFVMPYNQNKEPLDLARFGGNKIEVNSFGIPNEDQNTYFKLRSQAKILFSDRDRSNNFEFAIDLCANSPRDQIVVAKIAPCSSLFLSLEYIAAKTLEMKTRLNGEESEEAKYQQSIQPLDSVLVPNFNWRISHHFSELEGRKFIDPKFSKQYISVAQEDIVFELQKGGAELVAESKIYYKPTRRHFDLDGPFLLYLKSRDAVSPYFVMWIANGELLSPFQKGNEKE
jgi:hypothetical protein